MSDIFQAKSARPMLIQGNGAPFDSPDYIFELKLDGERFLAYLDEDETTLINRRGVSYSQKFPELADMHRASSARCILDGEIVVLQGGTPDFQAVRARAAATGARVALGARQAPVSFVAFDILYVQDREVTGLAQMARRRLLEETIAQTPRLSLSRYVDERGRAFFDVTRQHGLEGIIAKRKDAVYRMGKRTGDWVKIKNVKEDDFVVCGYFITPPNPVASLVLGQYDTDGALRYRGRATLGLKTNDFAVIQAQPRQESPAIAGVIPAEAMQAIWLAPTLVATIGYLHRTEKGGLRHPQFKGLRPDKHPREAVTPEADAR